MIKFFRKIRQNLLVENKFSKYLFYAIGEILLVVIGILIAVNINNWNEHKQSQNEFKSILTTIKTDLERDTLMAQGVIKYYKKNEETSLKVINKKITFDNIEECKDCRNLITIYRPFIAQTKGHDLFKKYTNQNSTKNDSLVINISQFYGTLLKLIDDSNQFIKDEVFSNLNHYKSQSWFADFTQGEFTYEMKTYFLSQDYRNRVASHHILAGKNHLLFVDIYKKNATKILEAIDKRLNEGD